MRKILTWALALSLCAVGLSSCYRDNDTTIAKDGINGKNGANGKDGNTILYGKGQPLATLGKIGDFYLDESTKNLYGPKSDKGWGNPASLKGKDGTNGTDGKNGSKILKGNTVPSKDLGSEGDWYIDVVNKKIYYKNANNWEEIFNIGSNNAPTTLKGDYILSKDGTILYTWLNKELSVIDMQKDPELSKVTTIGDTAFNNHTNLNKITLPNGLKKIGNNAFVNASLTSIAIPDGVTSIGFHAFSRNRLTSATIPNSVTNVGDYAFYGNQLTTITIPTGLTRIGVGTFSNNQLANITIPSNVESIANTAFSNNLLTLVKVDRATPPKAEIEFGYWGAFGDIHNSNNLTISVPNASIQEYNKAEGWSEYIDKIRGY